MTHFMGNIDRELIDTVTSSLKPTLVIFYSFKKEMEKEKSGEKTLLTIAEELHEEMLGSLAVMTINTDNDPALLSHYSPHGFVPCTILFRDGVSLWKIIGNLEQNVFISCILESCKQAPSPFRPKIPVQNRIIDLLWHLFR